MMMKFSCHRRQLCTLLSVMLLAAVPAFGQVPQDVTYTGRLVNDSGNPLAGPVDLELRVLDDATAGTQLYSEQHVGVALDATGGFSVQLGLGTDPSGTFDAALFAEVNRWLEVVVGADVLTPRQIIASVPWALIAQQANAIVREAQIIDVDCDGGDVLQDVIDRAGPETTINVQGTCTENITIHSWQHNLTIDGQSSSSIDAANDGQPVVRIRGREIIIKGFASGGSISGGRNGIRIEHASARIEGNVIEGNNLVGISVGESAYSEIMGNTIQNNGSNGIGVSGSSSTEIGDCGGQSNAILSNGGHGVAISQNSTAVVMGNQITDNADVGIFVVDGSMADTGSNVISGNIDGVDVRRGAVVRMGRQGLSGACIENPNSTVTNNTGYGIQCSSQSVVDGELGSLNGVAGATSLDESCFSDLAP